MKKSPSQGRPVTTGIAIATMALAVLAGCGESATDRYKREDREARAEQAAAIKRQDAAERRTAAAAARMRDADNDLVAAVRKLCRIGTRRELTATARVPVTASRPQIASGIARTTTDAVYDRAWDACFKELVRRGV